MSIVGVEDWAVCVLLNQIVGFDALEDEATRQTCDLPQPDRGLDTKVVPYTQVNIATASQVYHIARGH